MSCCKGRNAVGVQSCVVLQGKEMPEALDKGSQPYSRAFRHREMAGVKVAPNNICLPLGRRHG